MGKFSPNLSTLSRVCIWGRLWGGLLVFVAGVQVQAGTVSEREFGIHPELNSVADLGRLYQKRLFSLRSQNSGSRFTVDVSFVTDGVAERVFQSALDYDRYTQMRMPHLDLSKRLTHDTQPDAVDRFLVYSRMSILTFSSSQFMEVSSFRGIKSDPADAADLGHGISWELRSDLRRHQGFSADPSFDQMFGSFYVETLTERDYPGLGGKLYVRYYLSNDVKVLGGLFDGIIMSQLKDGAKEVIQVLLRDARKEIQ